MALMTEKKMDQFAISFFTITFQQWWLSLYHKERPTMNLELLAAENLIGANLNGMSDPYAIITCVREKRFSSMVSGSRDPMWGGNSIFLLMNCLLRAWISGRGCSLK